MFALEMGKKRPRLSSEALVELQNYAFPGNVRELKNIIEHALIRSGGAVILPEHLHLLGNPDISVQPIALSEADIYTRATNDFERRKQLVIKRAQNSSSQEQCVHTMTDEEKIFSHVSQHGSINNTECRQLLSSDYYHASYMLKKLHGYGLLIREGDGRWARYHLPFPSEADTHSNML